MQVGTRTLAAGVLVAPALLLGLLGAGCSKKDAPSGAGPAASATAAAVTAPSAGSVGIAACDDYLQKWEACVRRTGALTSLQMVDAQRKSFAQAAATPEGKAGLEKTCQSLTDKLASSKACGSGSGPK